MLSPRLVLVVPALVLIGGCSPLSFDAKAESINLLKRDAEWADAASAGKDIDRIMSFVADDIVMVPPGQPIAEGKEAFRAFVTASLAMPGFRIHWVSSDVRFSPDGRLAYLRGTNETTVPGANGNAVTIPGRGITIWRRDADGQWQCVLDIWNDPPAAAPAMKPGT